MGESLKAVTSRLSIGVVSAIVAAVVASGGVAYASVANNSVTSAKIVNETIRGEDLANNSVSTGEIVNNTVASNDIKNGAIAPADLSPATAGGLTSALLVFEEVAVSAGSESSLTAEARCPANRRALAGGGEETNTSVRSFLVDSHPSSDGLGWVVRYRSDDGVDLTAGDEVTAYVTCGPLNP